MYKRKYLVLAVLMLVGIMGIFTGCASGAPYDGMRVNASKKSISLTIELNSNGEILPTSNLTDTFTASVSNAPDTISKNITAMSLDSSVATAKVERSGSRRVITVNAVNGGKTQIKVMTGGGGSEVDGKEGIYALVDVVVDVPPVNMSIKDDVYFGVAKGGIIELSENSFNFYASSLKTTSFATTLNSVSYEFHPEYKTAAENAGCLISDSTLLVGNDYDRTDIKLVPTLKHNNVKLGEPENVIVVQVFDTTTLRDFSIKNSVISQKTSMATVELQKNVQGYDIAQSGVLFNGGMAGEFGTSWGYSISSYDDSFLYIDDQKNGNFDFLSMGIGETDVGITVYPIREIGGKLVHFNKSYHNTLQIKKPVKVEIRNVFKANELRFINSEDKIINKLEAFFSLDPKKPVRSEFTFGTMLSTDPSKMSNLLINNTGERPQNNFITLSIYGVGSGITSAKVFDVFDITYKPWPYTGQSIPMQEADNLNGVPYNAMFSISLKDAARDFTFRPDAKLIAKSIDGVVTEEIFIDSIYEISSFVGAVDYSHDAIGGNHAWNEIDKVCPVISGTEGTALFNLVASQNIANPPGQTSGELWYDFVFEDEEGVVNNVFEISNRGVTANSLVSWFTLRFNSADIDLTKRYSMKIRHKSGPEITLSILILNKLEAQPVLSIIPLAGGSNFYEKTSANKITAFVRANQTYLLDVVANPKNVFIGYGYTFSNATLNSLKNQGIVINGDRLTPTREGAYNFRIDLTVYNVNVFSTGMERFINVELVVVNPIVSVSFSKNNVSVLSKETLGYNEALGLTQAESKVAFNLQLFYDNDYLAEYFSGYDYKIDVDYYFTGMQNYSRGGKNYSGNGVIELWQDPANPTRFELQGLQASVLPVNITFIVNRVFIKGADTVEINFLSSTDKYNEPNGVDEGSHFFATVVDAAVVENIFVSNAGAESLDIMLDKQGAGVKDTYVSLKTVTYPQSVNNSRLGFGFINPADPTGFPVQEIKNASNEIIISINQTTGQITASKSNILPRKEIQLVVYALDSLNGSAFPGTYITLSVNVYDTSETRNERVIRNLEEFLDAFYIRLDKNISFVESARRGQLSSRANLGVFDNGTAYNCYYQLTADIDLSPVYELIDERVIHLPIITGFGSGATAVFTGAKPSSSGVSESYTISNFIMSNERADYTTYENYGFFDIIGQYGTVDSISFKNVSGSIRTLVGNSRAEQNIGVVAAINNGTISNVYVETSNGNPLQIQTGRNAQTVNVGGIVGKNEAGGIISEDVNGQMNVEGTIEVSLLAGYTAQVNFGGIVGKNVGTVEGKSRDGLLNGDVFYNSGAILVVEEGQERSDFNKSVNVGGIAGLNTGASATINWLSSQSVIYNSLIRQGNSGGIVGHNTNAASIKNSTSCGAVYARNAIGGIAGRNSGLVGGVTLIENCYYENYLNTKVGDLLADMLNRYVDSTLWKNEYFYAGLIADNLVQDLNYLDANMTSIGGVVGINASGDVKYSFASSSFNNQVVEVDLINLPYKGDICLFGAKNATVGGVIGRQSNLSEVTRPAEIEGCYSTLTVYFDDLGNNSLSSMVRVGGVIGQLNGAYVNISYCYSNVDLILERVFPSNNGVSFGGLVNFSSSTNVANLSHSYGVVMSIRGNGSNVFTKYDSTLYSVTLGGNNTNNLVIRPATVMYESVTYPATAVSAINTWTTSVSGKFAYGVDARYGNQDTKNTGYKYPVLWKDNNPYVIAVPKVITLSLKSHAWYADSIGKTKNNRGGYNLIVPHESGDKAAIFYSGGGFTTSSIVANRYYINDLFDVNVDPEIAANRIEYVVEGVGDDIVARGYHMENSAPRYYIDIKKSGKSFDLVVRSTRYSFDEQKFTDKKIKFEIVNGIGTNTATASISGLIGRKSLDSKSNVTGIPFDHQTNVGLNLSGSTDSRDWNILISTKSIRDTELLNSASEFYNSGAFVFKGEGEVDFAFTPVIEIDGVEYLCKALTIEVTAIIFGGALKAGFDQSVTTPEGTQGGNVIDPASGSVFTGYFVTDRESTGITNEQKLLSVSNFTIKLPDGFSYSLFANNSTLTTINVAGQSVSLKFELKVTEIIPPGPGNEYTAFGDYTLYRFLITVTVVVDQKIYNVDIKNLGPIVAFDENFDFKAIMTIIDKQSSKNGATLKYGNTNIELVAQDLQAVEFQHFADTYYDDNKTLTVDESQQSSMVIYTQSRLYGLLKVHTFPSYAAIKDFKLSVSKPYMQKVGISGEGKDAYPVYEVWSISLIQKIWDAHQKKYVNFSESVEGTPSQVSVKNADGSYSWNGVYYLQTALIEPEYQYIWKAGGEPENRQQLENTENADAVKIPRPTERLREGVFTLKGDFTTNDNKKIERNIKISAMEKPGIYYEVDGSIVTDTEQAVGTLMDFKINRVPADKTYLRGTPVVRIVGDDDPIKASIHSFNSATGEGKVWVSADISFTTKVEILCEYEQESNGVMDQFTISNGRAAKLVIKPVLFKIRGINILGQTNPIRLDQFNNREAMELAVDVTYGEGSTTVGRTLVDIFEGIKVFNRRINQDFTERIEWSAVGQKLNDGLLDAYGYYDDSKVRGQINFYLGMNNTTGIKFISDALGQSQTSTLDVDMFYSYESGLPVLKDKREATSSQFAAYRISTLAKEAEVGLVKIYDASQLRYMSADFDYILMNNIELSDWVPIEFKAKSLDGNNKTITINSFNLTNRPANVGLFTTVAQKSVVKNLIIVLPNIDINLSGYASGTARMGVLAGVNNGIITNCAVVNSSQLKNDPELGMVVDYDRAIGFNVTNNKRHQQLTIISTSTNLTVHFGGLVGENNSTGVISNSRVMIDIIVSRNTESDIANIGNAIVAGFIAINNGTVVNSYFRDSNIRNSSIITSGQNNYNLTAGFVGRNTGTGVIKGCYAMGVSNDLNTVAGQLGCVRYGEIRSNNGVGGFIYENGGNIQDCYANVIISLAGGSSGTVYGAAGFVFSNTVSGNISNCLINNENSKGIAQYYRVYRDNIGKVSNCKVVSAGRGGFVGSSVEGFEELNENQLSDFDKFTGFSIATYSEEPVTVWQMVERKIGETVITAPELASANIVAISIRSVDKSVNGAEVLSYSAYALGSKHNPILITNADEFDKIIYIGSQADLQDSPAVLTPDFDANIYNKHIRLVNNISFTTDLASNRLLRTYKIIFQGILDGNGLSINGINTPSTVVSDTDKGLQSAGLFSRLENATVKNVTLGVNAFSNALNTDYVGGLAGIAVNSNLVDINVVSSTTSSIVIGNSVVGGVVGYVDMTEENIVKNVKSNVRTEAINRLHDRSIGNVKYENAIDYINRDHTKINEGISVAGGVFGMIDGKGSVSNIGNYNLKDMDIAGEVVGGLVGVVYEGIQLSNINYNVTTATSVETKGLLRGKIYIGGLVGINLGEIKNSAINLSFMHMQSAAIERDAQSLANKGEFVFTSFTNSKTFYHGMTVGGAVGFNAGTLDGVAARVGMNTTNIVYTLVSGGIVGENFGGTVQNCIAGGQLSGNPAHSSINGGYYIGGVIGLNNMNSKSNRSAVVENNNINYASSTYWGSNINFSNETSVAGSSLSLHSSVPFHTQINSFFFASDGAKLIGQLSITSLHPTEANKHFYTYRPLFTGLSIGANFDRGISFTQGTVVASGSIGTRHLGMFSVARNPLISTMTVKQLGVEVSSVRINSEVQLAVSAQTVNVGDSLSYQWYVNTKNTTTGATAIPGATLANFTYVIPSSPTTLYFFVAVNTRNITAYGGIDATVKSELKEIRVVEY